MINSLIDAPAVADLLPFDRLVAALREGFTSGVEVPERHHHTVGDGDDAGTLLLMPCWSVGGYLGVKIASVFPANRERGLPTIFGSYLLCDAATGEQLAFIDGTELTRRRTIAASALAASYLARPDARTLLIVGSGAIASLATAAYRAVRPIERVLVWNVRRDGAVRLAERLCGDGVDAEPVDDLRAGVGEADVVSCATLATEPLVQGEWLGAGTHLDLIGSFRPHMREADDAAMTAGSLFVDTLTALEESGDLLGPLNSGALARSDVRATLTQLCRGEHAGRAGVDEITVFKSVGTAVEDLAAAALVYNRHSETG